MEMENFKIFDNFESQKINLKKKKKKKVFFPSKNYFFFYCKNFPFFIQKKKNFPLQKIENFFLKKNSLFGVSTENLTFPKIWSMEKRYQWLFKKKKFSGLGDLEISQNKLKIKYRGLGKTDEDAAGITADNFIPNNLLVFYFEIKVLNIGKNGFIGVGLCEENTNLDRLPGWEKNSLGYHGDDGYFFRDSGTGIPYGPCFGKNDVVGVCINFIEKIVFFTKNGLGLKIAFSNILTKDIKNRIPFIGLRTKEECVEANFGGKIFEFDLNSYKTYFQKTYEEKIFLFHRFFFKRSPVFFFLKKPTNNKENTFNFFFTPFFLLKKNYILKFLGKKYHWKTFFLFLKSFLCDKLLLKKKSKKNYFLFLFNLKNILDFFSKSKNFLFKMKKEKSGKNFLLKNDNKFFRKKKNFKVPILKKKFLYFFEKEKLIQKIDNFLLKNKKLGDFLNSFMELYSKILIKWKENSDFSPKSILIYPFFDIHFLKKLKIFKKNNHFEFFNLIMIFLIHKRLELFDLENWLI